jgi:hypothetical protein
MLRLQQSDSCLLLIINNTHHDAWPHIEEASIELVAYRSALQEVLLCDLSQGRS